MFLDVYSDVVAMFCLFLASKVSYSPSANESCLSGQRVALTDNKGTPSSGKQHLVHGAKEIQQNQEFCPGLLS